jgi:cell division transport system permease protein
VTDQEISAFESLLEKNPAVKSARFISKQEALDSLKKDLGEDATSMLEVNPLPASFELKLNAAYTSQQKLQSISEEIQQNKMVREVTYQRTEVDRMNENFRIVAIGILAFCVLLLFIAVALINSTIRISMYSRRFLIKSMQLVGATKSFIRRPFITRAITHGFYSGLFACMFLSGLLYLIRTRLPEFVQLQDLKENAMLFAGILAFGVMLSVLSTWFAVNRYLRIRIDELYG